MDKSILLEKFTLIGINHHLADVRVREKFSLSWEEQSTLLEDAKVQGISGMIIVSTCNRTEIFATTSDAELLSILFCKHSKGSMGEFKEYGFIRHGEHALRHFYRVAVGLEAQILGDLQIIKQVKESYRLSSDLGLADSVIHRLMQSVTRTHKRTRNETSLGMGAASTAYAAVQLAKRRMKKLTGKKVLLVGAGKIGKVTCKNLIAMGASDVTVINRNMTRAERLSMRFPVNVAPIKNIDIEIARADLIIVATGASHAVINHGHMDLCDPEAGEKLMIDLSVPRNIADEVGEMPFVHLINMDMLSDTLDETFRERQANIPHVERIIEEEFDQWCTWLSELRVVPTIRAINTKFDQIRRKEIERFRHKMNEETMTQVEHLTQRIINKIVAHSIEHLKENQGRTEEVTRIIHDMYKIGDEV
ncbi:glutamyl-tRNA reductase [Cyclonatronum proteinivorum]|uniref:Glutamyl-tRNA reductase n=1 Tax=Cyclonatronum proteinivorum TaxID=1457365 RepID=A0A345UNK9_9BACT|nr:glutamyl-tRNA reductase [Cyclonatronum proteinivorum]AXJ02061.1 glutamyl-tRNA reductase [Cyclonatronum proteinivorum]